MKFCPNCGEPVEGDTRFCTHCGFDLSQAKEADDSQAAKATTQQQSGSDQTSAPAQPAGPDRMTQLQTMSKNYFQWFVDSLKRPNEEAPAEKYFGVISMLISGFLLTFAIVAAINRFIKQISEAANNTVTMKSLSFSLDFKLFVFVIIGILLYVLIGFGASAFGNKHGNLNFFDYVNRFGHITNIGIIVDFVLILSVYTITYTSSSPMTVIKQLTFTMLVLMVIGLIWQVGYVMAINDSIDVPRIDKIYVILLALIVLNLAFYIFMRIEGENLLMDLSSEFSPYSSFGSLF